MKTATRTENIPLCKKHGEFDPCGECASVPQETPTDYVWHGDSGHPEGTPCAICGSQETPAQHSPLPWRHQTEDGSLGSIVDANSVAVAQTQQRLGDSRHAERQANAAFIVKCVNRDPAFQKVLEDAQAVVDCFCLGQSPEKFVEQVKGFIEDLRGSVRLARQGEGE